MDRTDMLSRLAKGESPLEVSIQKWQDIVDGTGKDDASNNCALCETCDNPCVSCIIYKKVGHGCSYTQYNTYVKKRTKANAQAELDFLKSLREEIQ